MTDSSDKRPHGSNREDASAELHTARVLRRWLPEIPYVPLREHYELTGRELGSGGYGKVIEARKLRLPQTVAIKRIQPDEQFSEVDQRRFVREVQLVAPLIHPNIVQIFDWGCDDDGLYIVMELIDGPNLADLVQQNGRLSVERLLSIADQICQALQYVHQQGIVHRDVKPANLLLARNDRIKLADFGLARQASDQRNRVTSANGGGPGADAYASPEQLRGDDDLDCRSCHCQGTWHRMPLEAMNLRGSGRFPDSIETRCDSGL